MAAACTDKVCQVNLAEERSSIGQWPGRIGKHETTALRIDTGATISVVHRKLISDEELTGRQVAIKPLDAEPRWYPTAFIEVEIDNWRAFREVAVSNTIAYDAILELDIPVIRALDIPVIRALDIPVIRALDIPVIRALDIPVIRALDIPVIRALDIPVIRALDIPVIRALDIPVIRALDIPVIRELDIPVIRALVYRPSAPAEVFQVQTRATSKREANSLQEDGEAEEWREAEIPNQIIAAATEGHESDETSMPTTESDSDENDPTELELDEYWLHQERTDRSVLTPVERLERKQEELSRKKQPDRDQLVSEQYQDTTEHSDEEEDEEAMLETWKQLHTEGEIVLEPGTSLEQAAELTDLVDAFRKSVCSGRTKQTPFTELQIQTKDAQPIHLPPYCMPRARHECVQTEVKKMLEADLIWPSTSPWASPIVPVPKEDGSWRFCVNYQKLNAVTEADPFPIPRVDDLLEELVHAKYRSTLDLLEGYWQVPVSESSQPKTAFVTPFGKYEFKVMPFGLVGAPATFQRLMNEILSPVREFAIAYMDDICIFNASWTEHL